MEIHVHYSEFLREEWVKYNMGNTLILMVIWGCFDHRSLSFLFLCTQSSRTIGKVLYMCALKCEILH